MSTNVPLRSLHAAATLCGLLSGLAVLLLAAVIGADVVLRKLAGTSILGTDELGGYVLAMTGSLALSYALIKRSHTRFDILVARLPDGFRVVSHLFALGALFVYAVALAWYSTLAITETLRLGSISSSLQVPLWIPQTVWVFGNWLFAATMAASVVHAVVLAFTDRAAMEAAYGVGTAEEEVHELQESLSRNRNRIEVQ